MWNKQSKTKEPENANKAYEYAVFLLSLKLRTVGEVLKKMEGRGYTSAIIEQIIDRLKSQKYLDDQRYAEIYLENLKMYKNFGYYGIKKKMMEKKLPQGLVESILTDGLSIDEELKMGKRLLKKQGFETKTKTDDNQPHYMTYGNEDKNKQRQKMAQKLKVKGFRGEVVAKLIF